MKVLRMPTINPRPGLAALIVLSALFALLVWAAGSWAQSPIPHAVQEGDDCLSCHQTGVAGAPRVAWDHRGRSNEDCQFCHQVTGAPAGQIPHPIAGREDCLSCHREGIGSTPALAGNHVYYVNEECALCHLASPAALEPTPIPLPTPPPVTDSGGANTCMACHQLIFADEQHVIFTGQPLGDAEAGEKLFAQLCAGCHGADGQTPKGDAGTVINSAAYWGTHDDAAILIAIAAGAQAKMPAFAEAYGGPLSWEAVLSLAAFVRTWGPVAPPSEAAGTEAATYTDAIGSLLTDRCGMCHGGAAGLTVTDYQSLMAGAASGPVILPGDPEGSGIVQVQRGQHYARLSEAELDLLVEWIANGAPE